MRVAETPARDLLERLEPRNGRAHVVVRGSVVRVERRGGDGADTIYVGFRAAYPFLLRGSDGRLSKLNPKLVLVATLPNYLIIFYFLGATAAAVY